MVEQSTDKEQMKQVIQFLDSKEARGQALDIILAYSTTKQNRELFNDTEICKQLLRLLPESDVTEKAGQCLINFSHDENQIKTLIGLNVASRVLDFLKENVKMNMQSIEQSSATLNQDEKVYEIKQGVPAHGIEYCMMILCNVTVNEDGQKHLLGEGKLKGLVLDNLFGMFCYFSKSGLFDFVSNVLSNVSSLKEGREYMMENKMVSKIIELLKSNTVNEHRKNHLISTVRNIAFEYEKYEQQFIDTKLIQDVSFLIAQEQGIKGLTGELSSLNATTTKEKEQIDVQNSKQLLDTLIVLANSDKLLTEMMNFKLDQLLDHVYTHGIEDMEIQLQVLKNQITAGPQPHNDEDEDEKQD